MPFPPSALPPAQTHPSKTMPCFSEIIITKKPQTTHSLEFLATPPGKIPFCLPSEEYNCIPRYHPVCFSALLNTPVKLGWFQPGFFLDLQLLRLPWALLLQGQPFSPCPPRPQWWRFQHGYYLRCDKFLDVMRDGPSSCSHHATGVLMPYLAGSAGAGQERNWSILIFPRTC